MAWIINQDGFFSVVKKDCEADELLVRARVHDDLKRLAEKLNVPAGKIVETPMADYRYRMIVKAGAISTYLAKTVEEIDYGNFKASLPHTTSLDKKRSRAYADVWTSLYRLQN